MIRARSDKIRRVGAKRTVPYPPLVAREGGLEREWLWLRVDLGRLDVHLPDLGRVICAACCELLHIWGEKDSRDVFFVRGEVSDGKELSSIKGLKELPDKDIALEERSQPRAEARTVVEERTLLFAAQRSVPSLATVTLETETSSSGINWCEQLFSARSHTRTLPPRSQEMISPWLG